MMGFSGKVAAITGASSGIGAALAAELSNRGARVGLIARRTELLDAVADRLRQSGAGVSIAPADVSDQEQTFGAVARIEEELGPIDLMFANAGLGIRDDASNFSLQDFERMVSVNLLGSAYAFQAVLPSMIERKTGHLVGISSLVALRGLPGSAGYCATKAGLTALLEAFRPELHPLGIRVTSVHPGFVTTPMIAGAKHSRPFEMSAARAARIIANGIERGRSRVDFPWPTVALLRLVQHMPNWLFDRLAPAVIGSSDH